MSALRSRYRRVHLTSRQTNKDEDGTKLSSQSGLGASDPCKEIQSFWRQYFRNEFLFIFLGPHVLHLARLIKIRRAEVETHSSGLRYSRTNLDYNLCTFFFPWEDTTENLNKWRYSVAVEDVFGIGLHPFLSRLE